MKTCILFAGEDYYPCGGSSDTTLTGSSVEELKEKFKEILQYSDVNDRYEWVEIIDLAEGVSYRSDSRVNRCSGVEANTMSLWSEWVVSPLETWKKPPSRSYS